MSNLLPITSVAEKFWRNVEKGTGCWGWRGARFPTGYGALRYRGNARYAHRISWEIHFGPIPDGLCVLHRCDNPSCTNPLHLFLGTQKDNGIDMARKGRGTRGRHAPYHTGVKNPQSKLTEEQVREIRSSTEATRALARRLGVHARCVHLARTGKTWKHVT